MAQKKVLTETGLSRLVTLINEKYAPSISPALTGTPTAPTPATNDESTKIATTEFVKNKLATDFTAFTKAEIYMMFGISMSVTVTIEQSEHQTIHVTVDGTDHTETFTALAGSTYTATIIPDTGYTAGTISSTSGTIEEAITISTTAATLQTFTLTLAATENQTITLTYTEPDEEAVTVTSTSIAQEITVDYDTTWTASIVANTGYTAGTLSAASGTVTEAITVSATEASIIPKTPLNLFTYAQNNITNYDSITTLPQSNTEELTNIIPESNASEAFEGCANLTSLSGVEQTWDMSNVTDMERMFSGCSSLTLLDLSNWDVSNVTNADYMFSDCSSLEILDLSNWENNEDIYMGNIFSGCDSLKYIIINSPTFKIPVPNTDPDLPYNSFCALLVPANLKSTYKSREFWYKFIIDDIEKYTITKSNGQITVTPNFEQKTPFDISGYAENNIANYETITTLPQENIEELTNIALNYSTDSAFRGCSNLTSLNGLEQTWDTTHVTDMSTMFLSCSSLTSLDLSNWNTFNVTRMTAMFSNCSSLEVLDLSNWDTTNIGTDTGDEMEEMLANCTSLQYLIISTPTFKFPITHSIFNDSSSDENTCPDCKILVPSNLISTYQNSWGYSEQFDAIENYTITRSNGQITVTPNA